MVLNYRIAVLLNDFSESLVEYSSSFHEIFIGNYPFLYYITKYEHMLEIILKATHAILYQQSTHFEIDGKVHKRYIILHLSPLKFFTAFLTFEREVEQITPR